MFQRELREDQENRYLNGMSVQDSVKILLVGDSGSGKTSLIYSLISDDFDFDLPPNLGTVTIPAEVTPDRVPIQITDYSERDISHRENQLNDATGAADVICIVYIAGDDESLMRVAQYWIPTVRGFDESRGSYRPIILVANKVDLLPEMSLSENIATIRQIFMDVEAHIQVSALTQKNVVELFSSAQKAITYPIAPLFDTQTRTLTKSCRNALTEIFKLNDLDGDGLLNDRDLILFQENHFGIPLQRDSLDDIKQVIKQSTSDGISNDAITLAGFLFLHELSIDKGRRDFTWQVLRSFNYNNQLESPTIAKKSSLSNTTTLDETTISTKITTTNDESNDESSHESLSDILDESENYLAESSKSPFKGGKNASRELMNTLDFPWLKQNPIMFKAGVGITVTTFISFMALRYLSASKS